MANAKFIDATTWGNLTEIDVTDGENLFPQLPAGTYRPVLSGVDSVTVPALSAGTIDQATPSEGDTLTVSGSNATGSATYQWQKDGVDISGATSASLDTTGEGAGDFRRGVSDGVQGPVYTSAVTVSAASGALWDDQFLASQTAPLPSYTLGDVLSADTAGAYVNASDFGEIIVTDVGGTRAIQIDPATTSTERVLYDETVASDDRIVTFVIEQMPTFSTVTELYCAYTDSDNRINATCQPDGNWSAQVRIGGTNRVNAFITDSDLYAGAELTVENDTSTNTVSFKVDGVHVSGSPFSVPVSTAGLGKPGFRLYGNSAQTNLALSRFKIEET